MAFVVGGGGGGSSGVFIITPPSVYFYLRIIPAGYRSGGWIIRRNRMFQTQATTPQSRVRLCLPCRSPATYSANGFTQGLSMKS